MKPGPMDLVGYFGFGSLVNQDTLRTSYVDIVPAKLKGWRRHWQARTGPLSKEVAMLSVHEDEQCDILGALVIDRSENLPSVDEREAGYTRRRLRPEDLVLQARGRGRGPRTNTAPAWAPASWSGRRAGA